MIPLRRTEAPLAPPIRRGSMVARPWTGFVPGLRASLANTAGASARAPLPWERAARRRRAALATLVVASALTAGATLFRAQAGGGASASLWLQCLLFTVLFGWVAAGFFTVVAGFVARLRGDRHGVSARSAGTAPIDPAARTAIVMPIRHEDVGSVFANLRATWESLAATGQSHAFDLFVLSDSSDPAIQAEEEAAAGVLRAALGPDARVYYRCRVRRSRRKAGNIADFCRRWGRLYRYMVVLDADSVMDGASLVTLVRLMEANPRAGILQTAPVPCGVETPHARAQQFASRVMGRLYAAGMAYFQLGESHYWGHNAIIRVDAFMKHCGLALLPGRGGRGEEVLSHDFIEAALMRRAGYEVWLVADLEGSYEQAPPDLLSELQRDSRWCRGNLRNARLIAEPGLSMAHRAMLAAGAMAYLSAPLWLAFVLLGAALWVSLGNAMLQPPGGISAAVAALWLLVVTMLAAPRVLAMVSIALRGEARRFGGGWALLKSTLLEGFVSVLQAPVRMAAHTAAVVAAITGLGFDWKSPPRRAATLAWGDALLRSLPGMAGIGLVLAAVSLRDLAAIVWLMPVAVPLFLAAPLAVWTSRPACGLALRWRGWLVTPEEAAPPAVLRKAWGYAIAPAAPGGDAPAGPRARRLRAIAQAIG